MASDSPFPVLTGTLEPPLSPSSGRFCGHPGAFMSSAAQGGRASSGRASPTCPVLSQPGRLTRHLGSPVLFVASARALAVTRRWGCGSRPWARSLSGLEKRGTRAAGCPTAC